MPTVQEFTQRVTRLTWIVGLIIASLMLGSIGPAQAGEDPFASLAVQRSAPPEPAPNLELPSLAGGIVHLKDFQGKVVLLGFFSTT